MHSLTSILTTSLASTKQHSISHYGFSEPTPRHKSHRQRRSRMNRSHSQTIRQNSSRTKNTGEKHESNHPWSWIIFLDGMHATLSTLRYSIQPCDAASQGAAQPLPKPSDDYLRQRHDVLSSSEDQRILGTNQSEVLHLTERARTHAKENSKRVT